MCACYTGAVEFRRAEFGAGVGPIFLDQLQCSGSETSVLECGYSTPRPNCDHSRDAGVKCVGKSCSACWR